MNFQIPATTSAPAAGTFAFGTGNTMAATVPSTKTFGATGGGDAGIKQMSFGLSTTTAPNIATTTVPLTTPSFSLGSGLGISAPPAGTTTITGIAPSTITTQSAPAFGLSMSSTPAVSTTTTVFSFGLPTATTATVSSTTTTTLTNTTIIPVTTSSLGDFASLSTATKTTDSSTINLASQISYNQLEEHINKWTLELEDQEKVFTDQATQINAWDKILIGNNQKILDLNEAVQKVKSDQQTLEHELEFISTQHKELEESIAPLQKEFMRIPQVDVERTQTYLMVENLDTQLKQMSEDLKEIIDSLNESSKCQDNNDPIIQIGKILNAHMSSLQWIEHSSTDIGNKLDEITKMHETFKRDSERSFRSAYYN